MEFVVSDDHPGLKRAIAEVLPEAAWQRCYVHFLRNALDHLPRKAVDDCLQELRWLYDRRDLAEAQKDLAQWLERWGSKYSKLCEWAEESIGETLTFYRLPVQHHQHLKSTNMLERLNEEMPGSVAPPIPPLAPSGSGETIGKSGANPLPEESGPASPGP